MPVRRIGILGHYHGGNQGDECVVTALVQNLRSRCPQAELLGISLNPDDTRKRHRIAALPLRCYALDGGARRRGSGTRSPASLRRRLRQIPGLRRLIGGLRRFRSALLHALREPAFLWRSYRRLRDIDLLVVAGSGPFSDDWSGPWSHPYTLFKWAFLARLAGARFAPLCVGAGPIDSALSRALLRSVLRSSVYRSFRDPASAALIERIGVPGPHPVQPDLAFSLDLHASVHRAPSRSGRSRVVGLNPMAHKGYLEGDPAAYETYLQEMSDFALRLIDGGFQVRILYSQLVTDPRIAGELCERVARKLGGEPGDALVHEPIHSLGDLIRGILACDYVVACRYHLIILPQMLGRPVVGLAYHAKTWDLMEAMEMSDSCLDIERFDSGALFAAFTRLRADEERVKAVLAAKCAENRRALERQYDHLLGLVGGTAQ
jgi:polysaccharide pyruvyl transferase WcaK-like protein